MNKTELVANVSEKTGFSKRDCEKIVSTALESIIESLVDGNKVSLVGFGAFEVRARAARIGRNPKTKEAIHIPASKSPIFKPGKNFKETIAASK